MYFMYSVGVLGMEYIKYIKPTPNENHVPGRMFYGQARMGIAV